MRRKLFRISLLVVLLLVGTLVGQRIVDNHRAKQTVHEFLDAVLAGDRPRALALLDPSHPAVVTSQLALDDATIAWVPVPNADYRIHHIVLHGDEAVAQVWVERSGVAVKPLLHLVKSETGLWRVLRIEDVRVDPVWQDVRVELLADELAKALESRPGISVNVSRIPVEEDSGELR